MRTICFGDTEPFPLDEVAAEAVRQAVGSNEAPSTWLGFFHRLREERDFRLEAMGRRSATSHHEA
jgi:hypothetical protein